MVMNYLFEPAVEMPWKISYSIDVETTFGIQTTPYGLSNVANFDNAHVFLTLVAGYMSLWIVFDQYLVLLQYSANKNTQKIEYLFYVWVRVTSFKIVQLAWVVKILRCRNGLFC